MKLSLIQLTVGSSYEENFKKSQKLIIQSLQSDPDFILFPEHFLFLSNKNKISFEINHPAIIFFQEFATKYKVNILLGSLPIKENNKIFNRSLVIDFKGSIPDFIKFWQNIHSSWLPNSKFELDDRPHFERLPPSYNPMRTINEEEIWIPIK